MQISQEQQDTITTAFKSNDPTGFQAGGIKLGDKKYMYLRQQDNSFYGKKGVGSHIAAYDNRLLMNVQILFTVGGRLHHEI